MKSKHLAAIITASMALATTLSAQTTSSGTTSTDTNGANGTTGGPRSSGITSSVANGRGISGTGSSTPTRTTTGTGGRGITTSVTDGSTGASDGTNNGSGPTSDGSTEPNNDVDSTSDENGSGATDTPDVPATVRPNSIINTSTLASLVDDQPAILGFIIEGASPQRVLVRAVSVGLANFGILGAATDTSIEVYHNAQLVARNDNWGTPISLPSSERKTTSDALPQAETEATGAGRSGSADNTDGTRLDSGTSTGSLAAVDVGADVTTMAQTTASTGAFALSSGSTDSALVLDLPAGAYTVVVQGKSSNLSSTAGTATDSGTRPGSAGTTGGATQARRVLVEVYQTPGDVSSSAQPRE